MGAPLPTSTLSTFTAGDGDNLAVQDWPLPEGTPLRGAVLLVHGLGEHAGRYDALAARLNGWGFSVRGYDQCGHGDSSGARGAVPSTARLVQDLADMVESTRLRLPDGLPLFLLGHSMGGLVAACHVALNGPPVDGLVLSSPALRTSLTRWQRLLLCTLPRLLPELRVRSGLDPRWLSRDPDVVQAYQADPRVHDRVSARLARFIAEGGLRVLARARRWRVPTLLLYAGSDMVVDPGGSRAFAARAPAGVVTAQCFPDHFHEIFNEPESEPVFEALRQWLEQRCAGHARAIRWPRPRPAPAAASPS